jgi:hypothetical protein
LLNKIPSFSCDTRSTGSSTLEEVISRGEITQNKEPEMRINSGGGRCICTPAVLSVSPKLGLAPKIMRRCGIREKRLQRTGRSDPYIIQEPKLDVDSPFILQHRILTLVRRGDVGWDSDLLVVMMTQPTGKCRVPISEEQSSQFSKYADGRSTVRRIRRDEGYKMPRYVHERYNPIPSGVNMLGTPTTLKRI